MIARLHAAVGIFVGLAVVGVALLAASRLVPVPEFLAVVVYVIVAVGMTARAMTAARARTTPLGILIVCAAGAVLFAYLSLTLN